MKRQVETHIPTQWGDFKMLAYSDVVGELMPHIVLVREGFDVNEAVLVRIHSECLTGDLFSSKRCDCGEQLDRSMRLINAKTGVLIYLRQEGRGIGIINKLKAYNLQDTGLDTVEANLHLGLGAEERTFEDALFILEDLGVKKINLLTNNPIKLSAFEKSSITAERVELEIPANTDNTSYLKTKKEKMGHLLRSTF